MKKLLSKNEYLCRNSTFFSKRLIMLTLLATAVSRFAFAQGPAEEWRKILGGSGYEFSKSGIPTSDGGFLIGGSSDSEISGDKSDPNMGDWDFWIVKVDKAGNKQWDKTFGGTGEDKLVEIISTSGGYLLVGTSQSGIGGSKSQNGRGMNDFWVVKISSDGTKLWDKTFGGTGEDYITTVKTTSDGGYLLGGYSDSAAGGDKSTGARNNSNDYWVIKINANGGKVWDKTFGSYADDILIAIAPSTNGFLLAGHSNSKRGFEKSQDSKSYPENNPYSKSYDHWFIQIDNNGKKVWDKTFGTNKDEKLYSLEKSPDGGFVLGSTREFIYTVDEYTHIPYDNLLLSKVNEEGVKQWEKLYDPTPDVLEEIEVFSICSNSTGFYVLYNTQYGTDYSYVSKYNWSGASQYNNQVFDDFSYFVTFLRINASGELFLGFWKSQEDAPDYGLIKFKSETSKTTGSFNKQFLDTTISNLTTLATELISEFVAYPNPIQSQLNISLPLTQNGQVNLVLFDMSGKVYYSTKVELKNEKNFHVNLPVNSLKPGVYSLKITSASFSKVVQLNKD